MNETVPREKIEVYEQAGDQIILTTTATMSDGRSFSGRYAWPAQGGIAGVQEDVPAFAGITIIETLIAPGEWYATFLKNGKQLMVIHKVVGEDGKTLCLNYTGADAQGNSFGQTDVYPGTVDVEIRLKLKARRAAGLINLSR